MSSGEVLTRGQEVLAGAGRDAAAEAGTVAGRLAEVAGNAGARPAQLAAGPRSSVSSRMRRSPGSSPDTPLLVITPICVTESAVERKW